jgi:hypothetical protein
MWRLDVSSEAELEIFEAAFRYERERIGLGVRFETQVNTVFARLVDNPFQFPIIEEGVRRAIVRAFPYAVYFTLESRSHYGARRASHASASGHVETTARGHRVRNAARGESVYPGSAPGVESGMRLQGDAPADLQTNVFRYLAHQDPTWDVMSFELEKDLPLAIRHAGLIEPSDPNLSKFKNRGGKLIVYHGWADPGPAPASSINYYAKVAETLGGPQHEWMRLFLMPGMGHCRGGPGPNDADFVAALERWRESGVAPDAILASHRTDGRVDRTRPLCPFPQVARYKGTGSTDDAASFECRRP